MRTTALVRRPGPRLAEGLVTHIERCRSTSPRGPAVGGATARRSSRAGWDLVEVPPADDCPDAVFVEDTVVMFRNVARHHPTGRRRPQARDRRRREGPRVASAAR